MLYDNFFLIIIDSVIRDYILKQAPIVVLMGIAVYYFYKEEKALQLKLKEKEELILNIYEQQRQEVKDNLKMILDFNVILEKNLENSSKGNKELSELIKNEFDKLYMKIESKRNSP